MLKRRMMIVAAAAAMSMAVVMTAHAAGWGSDARGTWYQHESSSYAKSAIVEIDGAKYGFNPEGYMLKGWGRFDYNWYYFNPDNGAMMYGWVNDDGKWYYMDPGTGIMHKGWLDSGGQRYYMDENGVMQTGIFSVAGYRYRASEDGTLWRNWLEEDVVEANGTVQTRWYREDGTILYKTQNTQLTGNSWRIMLDPAYQGILNDEVKDEIQTRKIDKMDELEERYEKRVYTASSSKKWAKRLAEWEATVNRELGELAVPQEEINKFIRDIKAGTYDDSNYDYEDGEYDSPEEEYGDYDYEDEYYDDYYDYYD